MVNKGCLAKLGATALLCGLTGLTSCTKMIQPEQLNELTQLRASEARLTKQIADRETQKVKLQRELESRQQETKRCSEKRAFVQEKLNTYPQVLGESLPEAPPPPPEPEKKDTKVKKK